MLKGAAQLQDAGGTSRIRLMQYSGKKIGACPRFRSWPPLL
jgi:hypothetical protein